MRGHTMTTESEVVISIFRAVVNVAVLTSVVGFLAAALLVLFDS
jgi:hypothetical protein